MYIHIYIYIHISIYKYICNKQTNVCEVSFMFCAATRKDDDLNTNLKVLILHMLDVAYRLVVHIHMYVYIYIDIYIYMHICI